MTTKEAYQYFVLRAQKIAISKNWTPVNWYGDLSNKNIISMLYVGLSLDFFLYCRASFLVRRVLTCSFLDFTRNLRNSIWEVDKDGIGKV